MKMFLGGLAGSALSLALLSSLYKEKFDKARESRGWGDKGVVSAILGGFIQGSGMALAASCPGMAFAQLGAGVKTAPYVYLGGVAGAFVYGILNRWLQEHHAFDFAKTMEGKFESMHLERVFFSGQFVPIAISFGMLTLSVSFAIDHIVPWKADIADVVGVNPNYAINPTLAGLLIGVLQIPLFMFLGSFLGASSGYSVISSQVFRLVPEEFLLQYSYAKNFMNSKASWQVGLGIGIIIGSALASGFAKTIYDSVTTGAPLVASAAAHVGLLDAFIGGFLIVFGARFVGGCASGHGLSGLPSLHVVSWFTVPSMFAGAIFTGNVLAHLMGKSAYLMQQ